MTRPDGSRVEQRDVLTGAPERGPRRRPGKRTVAVLAAGGVLLVAAAVTVGVQRDRAQQGQVALALLPTGGVESQVVWELTGRTALVRWTAEVRNDGPRPVTVVRADLGSLRDDPTPRELAVGGRRSLSLTRIVRCVDPKGDPVPDVLSVQVTTARGDRTAALPVGQPVRTELDKAADRACGVLPLDEALAVLAASVERRGDTVLVALEAANASSRPLRLVRVVVAEGLGARALDRAGAPLGLPIALPPTDPGRKARPVQVQLVLTVDGCPPPAALAPAEDLPAGALGFVVDGGPGTPESGPVLTPLDDPAVQALDDEAC